MYLIGVIIKFGINQLLTNWPFLFNSHQIKVLSYDQVKVFPFGIQIPQAQQGFTRRYHRPLQDSGIQPNPRRKLGNPGGPFWPGPNSLALVGNWGPVTSS